MSSTQANSIDVSGIAQKLQSKLLGGVGAINDLNYKAIETLVRLLANKPDELDALVSAITSKGFLYKGINKCVTIERTIDGTITVHKNVRICPHEFYARIWRWPSLKSKDELKPIKTCQFGFDSKQYFVCVNPYHYERVVSPEIVLKSRPSNNEDKNGSTLQLINDSMESGNPLPMAVQQMPNSNKSQEPMSILQCALSNERIPPEFWCSIAYFEFDQPVGDRFKILASSVIIDGDMKPSWSNRICLGALSQAYRWNESSKARRLHISTIIGKGVQLDLRDGGDVWLKCLSPQSIFIQSPYLYLEAGRGLNRIGGDAIHKIYSQTYIKVFDLKECLHEMQKQLATFTGTQTELDDLKRFWTIRLSLVKGWGEDYAQTKLIEQTPCWIEIKLNRAIELLYDLLIKHSPNDNYKCSIG